MMKDKKKSEQYSQNFRKLPTERRIVQVTVSVVALIALFIHKFFPAFQIDDITLILLGIAVLPWLTSLIKTVEVKGIGKVEFQALEQKVSDMSGAVQSVGNKAELALATPTETLAAGGAEQDELAKNRMLKLANEYEHIRNTQSSGTTRTSAMTGIVKRMMDLASEIDEQTLLELLSADQLRLGQRLAAFAVLYARPNYQHFEKLVENVTQVEPKPFGQYWGLQAIRRVLLERGSSPVPEVVVENLRQFATKVRPGTDRAYEVKKILQELERTVTDD